MRDRQADRLSFARYSLSDRLAAWNRRDESVPSGPADDEGLSSERASVPPVGVGADLDGTGSLYERLAQKGLRLTRILQAPSAVSAPAAISSHLGIAPGAGVLEMHRSVMTPRRRPWRTS